MTTVPVDPQFARMLQPNFLCRNGQVVGVHTENAMRRHTNQIMAYRGKTFFTSPGGLGSVPASAGASRVRWRFRGYTSPAARRLVVHVIIGSVGAPVPLSDPYVLFTETISGGTLEFRSNVYGGIDVPSDLTYATASIDIDSATDIACSFTDINDARLISAMVYEELLPPDTANGLMMPIGAGTNILDEHRQQLAENLENIWESQGSQVWNWTADTAATAFTNATTTAKNLIDSSVTTVSAASPGATIDMTGKATRRQESTGVPVTMWVYASATTSSGAVRLVDSSGSTIITVAVSAGSAAWYSADGFMAASEDKYDLHGVAGASGDITVHAVSIFEFGVAGTPALTTYTITKTGGSSGSYDASAYTAITYASTISVQFTVGTAAQAYIVGLSADNPDNNYTGIDFGLLNDVGTMYQAENGSLSSLGSTTTGDVWKVTRAIGTGAVTYYKNGSLVATSGSTTTASLCVDSSFRFASDAVNTVSVTDAVGASLPVTWTSTNVTVT